MWGSVRNVLGICLEGLKRAAENFNQDAWSLCQELNPGPLTYEVDTLAIPW